MGSLRFGATGPWTQFLLPADLAGILGCTLIELAARRAANATAEYTSTGATEGLPYCFVGERQSS